MDSGDLIYYKQENMWTFIMRAGAWWGVCVRARDSNVILWCVRCDRQSSTDRVRKGGLQKVTRYVGTPVLFGHSAADFPPEGNCGGALRMSALTWSETGPTYCSVKHFARPSRIMHSQPATYEVWLPPLPLCIWAFLTSSNDVLTLPVIANCLI